MIRVRITNNPPARVGTYCIVNPDYQQKWTGFKVNELASRPTRNGIAYNAVSGQGLPATARFVDDTPVKFVRDLQYWVHGLCSENASISDAEKKAAFRSLWRDNAWMSNFAGTWSRADYINNNGLPPEIQIQPMATGGALLRVVGETRVKQTDCLLIEAINPTKAYNPYHPRTHPWLFFRPTLSVRQWIFDNKNNVIRKEEWYNEPFSQYAENAVVPVFGFVSDARSVTGWANVIEKYRVRILGTTEAVPNPFIIRGRVKPNPYEGF